MTGTREHNARALVDARSMGGRCEVCNRLGHEVHHRNKQGRKWTGGNLLRLCRGCHHWIEHHPTDAMLLGLWVPRETDPLNQPVFCHPLTWWLSWWLLRDDGTLSMVDQPEPSPELVAAMLALRAHLATVGGLS